MGAGRLHLQRHFDYMLQLIAARMARGLDRDSVDDCRDLAGKISRVRGGRQNYFHQFWRAGLTQFNLRLDVLCSTNHFSNSLKRSRKKELDNFRNRAIHAASDFQRRGASLPRTGAKKCPRPNDWCVSSSV